MHSIKTPESPQSQTHDDERNLNFPVTLDPKRWDDVVRPYSRQDVERLSCSFPIEYTLARRGTERLWHLLKTEPPVTALGALTGNQAVQQVRAGLRAIYLSGWQVAADDVPTVITARTDANAAALPTNDIDPRDQPFLSGERTSEGFFRVRAGIDQAIARALAYAPYGQSDLYRRD
jgi:isocitrate lyase